MAIDTTTLEAAYQAAIDAAVSSQLLDAIEAAQANLYLKSYVGALAAEHAVAGQQLTSFTLGGKTFSYRQPMSGKANESARYLRLLESMLGRYSPMTLLDLSGGRRTDA